MNPTATTWRLAPQAQLRVHYWEDECVLYHGASGDTHRLPALVGQLLERLSLSPATVSALADSIPLDAGDVAAALEELARMGITEPLP